MASLAIVTAGKMGGVFAGGNGAVMAAGAGALDLGVIHGDRRFPEIDGVTVLTHIGGQDVIHPLTGGVDTVVAAGTTINNIRMVKKHFRPSTVDVAGIAFCVGLYVARW